MAKKHDITFCCVCQQPARLVADTGMCGPCCTGEADMFEPSIGASNLHLTRSDLDEVLKADKGWTRYSNQGYEYVYEYCVPSTSIRIRVQSGVSIQTGSMDVPGLDAMRMFAISYNKRNGQGKAIVRGLCKAVIVRPAPGWQERLKGAYREVLRKAKGLAVR